MLFRSTGTNSLTWDGSAETDGKFTITGSAHKDTIMGGAGEDTFVLGTNLSSEDIIDGGDGSDTLYFKDNGLATSDLDGVTNVETVTLGDAATSITTKDSLLSSGQTLTVNAAALTGANSLIWDGSAESNAKFNIIGSSQSDLIVEIGRAHV